MNRNPGSLPGRLNEVKARIAARTKARCMYGMRATLRWLSVIPALVLALSGGSAAAAPTSTKTLLESLRRAMLSSQPAASIVSLHSVGSVEILGLRGRAQEWDDLTGVRFTTAQSGGALSGASGWDGKVAWSQDYAGLVTIDAGASGRLQAVDQAYLATLRYLRPDAGGAMVIYAGTRDDGGKSYDVLAVTPPRGSEIDLWLDPRTHLIARETATIGTVSSTTTLSAYRRVDGILYPFDSSTQLSNGNAFSERVNSLEVNTDVAERMRVPGQSVHDAAIAGTGSTTVPLQIVNNHVYVSGMLDGEGPYTFVLDSGGDYIITPEVAAALHATSEGGVQLEGAGSSTEGAAFAHLKSIEVGSATVRNQYTLVLPIATGFGVAEGVRIDGMLGYQFLARFLTTIDYANAKLTLAMPGLAPATEPGSAAIPFYIDGRIPRIAIGVDGVTTSAEVDTGNRAGLELSAPFLAAHAAIAALARTAPGVAGFGVGGPVVARLGRIPSLQIGPYAIANSVASFGYQNAGVFGDPFNPANVGGAIWRRFDLTFDYAHQQLLLARNAAFNEPFSYDRSGLFLIDSDGAYTVLDVLPGSPAAAAGVAKGDVLLAINGAPASAQSLAALRTLLSGAAGSLVRIHLRGPAGHERDATLKLADYI